MTGNANPDTPEFRHDQEAGLRALVEKYRDYVVAIGETGLDQHYLSEDPGKRTMQLEEQYYWFERMAHIARDFGLPLIIHSRDARRETIDAIKRFDIKYAVIHCFSEDADFARELMEFSPDIYFSFSGILTYKNAPDIQAAARAVPLDRILVETDAPFLSPNPVRGQVNEPSHTKHVLEFLTTIRDESPEEVERQVFENSLRFYQLQK